MKPAGVEGGYKPPVGGGKGYGYPAHWNGEKPVDAADAKASEAAACWNPDVR